MSATGIQQLGRVLEVPANNITCPICTWLAATALSLDQRLMTKTDVYAGYKVQSLVMCAGRSDRV